MFMKNNEEFRKDVYDRFDEYKEKKAATQRKIIKFGSMGAAAFVIALAVIFPITRISIDKSAAHAKDGSDVYAEAADGLDRKGSASTGNKGSDTNIYNFGGKSEHDNASGNEPEQDDPNSKSSETAATTSVTENNSEETEGPQIEASENSTIAATEGHTITATDPETDEFYNVFRSDNYSKFEMPSINARFAVNYGESYKYEDGQILWDTIVETKEDLIDVLDEYGEITVYYINDLSKTSSADYYYVIAIYAGNVFSSPTTDSNVFQMSVTGRNTLTICVFGAENNSETYLNLYFVN